MVVVVVGRVQLWRSRRGPDAVGALLLLEVMLLVGNHQGTGRGVKLEHCILVTR